MAVGYVDNIVTNFDFNVDDLATKWSPMRAQGAVTPDWYISGGQIHCDAGDGHAIYRTDVSAADCRNRLYYAAGSEADPFACPLAFPTVNADIIQVINPRFQGLWQFYNFNGSWSSWGTVAIPSSVQSSMESFEIAKQGNQILARAFDATDALLQEVVCPTVPGATYGAGVVAAPGVRATGADVDIERMQFASLAVVTLPNHVRGVKPAKAHRSALTRRGSGGSGVVARPTVGTVWPRGNRGR